MGEEALYYATFQDGAFDEVTADDVYDAADIIGNRFGDDLRDDVLDRYYDHCAEAATAGAVQSCYKNAAADSQRVVGQIADRVGASTDDVCSVMADALDGRPFAFDRLMADYFGR